MEHTVMNASKLPVILKSLLLSVVVTAFLLLLLAYLLFAFELDESKISVGILAVYLISCFLGGFLAGKKCGSRKFLWGFLVGSVYFALLFGLSLAAGHGILAQPLQVVTTYLLCAGGGMLGGMVS